MATVKSNSAFAHLQGKVGDLVYKHYGDRVVVTRVPKFSGPRSPKQRESARRFQRASAYAEEARKDPALWAVYAAQARKKKTPVRAVAIKDYLSLPKLVYVSLLRYRGNPGETISIGTGDHWKVIAVEVVMRDAAGVLIERGLGSEVSGSWSFCPTRGVPGGSPVTIEVTVIDRLGQRATQIFTGLPGARKPLLPLASG